MLALEFSHGLLSKGASQEMHTRIHTFISKKKKKKKA